MIILKRVKNLFGSLYATLRGRKPAPPSKSVDPCAYREESVRRPWTPPKEYGAVPSAPKPIRVTGDFMVGRPMPDMSHKQSSNGINQLQKEQQRRDSLRRQQAASTSPCTTIHGTREYEDTLTDTLAAAAAIAALIERVESVEPVRYEREPDPIRSGDGGSFSGGGADATWDDSSSNSDNPTSND